MMESKLPPGFRFHPRDEELVCDYLAKKIATETQDGGFHSCPMMIDIDLNKCEPWDLPGMSSHFLIFFLYIIFVVFLFILC